MLLYAMIMSYSVAINCCMITSLFDRGICFRIVCTGSNICQVQMLNPTYYLSVAVKGDLLGTATRTSEIGLTVALASTQAKNYVNSEQH